MLWLDKVAGADAAVGAAMLRLMLLLRLLLVDVSRRSIWLLIARRSIVVLMVELVATHGLRPRSSIERWRMIGMLRIHMRVLAVRTLLRMLLTVRQVAILIDRPPGASISRILVRHVAG